MAISGAGADAFDALLQRLERVPGPPAGAGAEGAVRRVTPETDLAARFAAELTAVGGEVHTCAADAVARIVGEVLAAGGAGSVYLDAATLADVGCHINELSQTLTTRGVSCVPAFDDDTLFSVDAAITGVHAAIAEIGALVCVSGPQRPRGASLISTLHVAIVPQGRILPDLCDAVAALAPPHEAPANANFICGPSKTADIEGVLVTGVHGPRRVVAIVVA